MGLIIEQSIYYYVCCIKGKGRALRKLDKELEFELYLEWKQYIFDKYKSIEFSRYLNQKIRNIKSDYEYRNWYLQI